LITTRGIVVVPDLPTDRLVHPARSVEVELRLPDGTRRTAALEFTVPFIAPTLSNWPICTGMLKTLSKADVPVGTEIWCDESVFVPADEEDAPA